MSGSLGILGCQRLEYAAHDFCLGLRYLQLMGGAVVDDSLLHGCRILERCVIHRDDGIDVSFLCQREDDVELLFLAILLPFCHQSLHDPEACDVLQEGDTAADAALVGKLSLSGFLGKDRFFDLNTQERPGT